MDKIIIILIIYNVFTNVEGSYSDNVGYLGPIVYSAEKPPILHFPAPERSNEAFILGSKPKTVKYVPLPRNELPVLIYQGEQPPIHVLQRNLEKKNENYILNSNNIPKPIVNSKKPQGIYIPLPISRKSSSGNPLPTYGPPPFIYTGHPPIHIYEESNSQYGPPTYEKGALDYLKDKGKEIQHGFESLLKDIHEKGKEFFDNPFNLKGKKQYFSYSSQQKPVYGPPKDNLPFTKFTYPTKSKFHSSKSTSFKPPYKHFSTYGPPKFPYATYTYSGESLLPGHSISGAYGKPIQVQRYKNHQYAPSYSDKQKYKLNPFETISNIFNNFKQQKSIVNNYPYTGMPIKPLPNIIPGYGPPSSPYPVKEHISDKGIKESFNAFLNSISNSKKQVFGSLSKGLGLQSNKISKPWKNQPSIYSPPIPNFIPGIPLGPNDIKIMYNYPDKQISNQPPNYFQTFNNVPLIPPSPFLKPNYGSPQYHQNIIPFKNGINIATQWKSSFTPPHGLDNKAQDYRTTSASKYNHPFKSEINHSAYNSMKHSDNQYPLKPFPISSSTIDFSKSKVDQPGYILAPETMKKPPIIIYQGYKPPIHVYESSAGINTNTLSEILGNNLGSSKHQDEIKSQNNENSNIMQYVSAYGAHPQMKISSTLEKNPIISSLDSSNKHRFESNLSKTSLPPPYSPPVIYNDNRKNIWTPVSNDRKHTTKAFDIAEKQKVAATLEIKDRT